jgi:PAS domain S-box-containing protein
VTLRRKILLAYMAVVALVAVLASGGFVLGERTSASLAEIDRTQDVLSALARLRIGLLDAETGQRGYLLTGRDVYLAPYNEAADTIAAQVEQLDRLLRQPRNQKIMVDVKRRVRDKLDELAESIRAKREQGNEAAFAIVNSDRGYVAMDQIRAGLDEVEERISVERAEAESKARAAQRAFETSAIAMIVVLVLGGGALAALLAQALTRRLGSLAESARAFGFGDRSRRARIAGHDEIALAGRAFDSMADLVERQEAELTNNRQRIAAVLDTLAEGVVVVDGDGAIHEANPAAELLFGRSAPELRGSPLAGYFPRVPLSIEQLANQPVRDQRFVESAIETADGERAIEIAVSRVAGEDDPLFVCVLRDLTERKRVERLKNEFVSTVSHELRTPLTSIAGSLDLISAGAAGEVPEQAASLVEIARKNSRRLVRLINDILDVEKIESGQLTLEFRRLNLRDIVTQSIDATRAFAREYGVEYRLVANDAEASVYGDADRLTQVLTNLLSNAAKFSPSGRVVDVTVTRDGDEARVDVRDYGPGISPEFRKRIFQRFAQADSSDTRGKGGTGLGLAIAKSLVERHGGRIGFDTETGQGTTFWFSLPALHPVGALPHLENPTGAPVLVVEDDEDVATLLRLILEHAGYAVDRVADLKEARRAVRAKRYAAMTLDLMLPDGNAVELVRELRSMPATADLKIVVVSAVVVDGKRELNGDAVSVVDWIPKPIDPVRLLDAVRLAVAGTARPRILHVEDDPDVARVTQLLLRDVGDVVAAPSVAAGRAAMLAERFDLLLLDIELPDGSGLELLPLARTAQVRPVPVIVFSADQVGEETARAVEATLVKSRISSDELAETIQRIVRSAP